MKSSSFAMLFAALALCFGAWAEGIFSTSGRLPAKEITGRTMPLTFALYDSEAPDVKLWAHSISVSIKPTGEYYVELSDSAGSDLLNDGQTLASALGRVFGTPMLAVANQSGRELMERQPLSSYTRAAIACRARNFDRADLGNGSLKAGTLAIKKVDVSGDVVAADVSGLQAEGVVEDLFGTLEKNSKSQLVLNGGVTGWLYQDGITTGVPIDLACPPGTVLDADAILTFRTTSGYERSRLVRRGTTVNYRDDESLISIQKFGGDNLVSRQNLQGKRVLSTGIYRLTGDIELRGTSDRPSALEVGGNATVVIELNGRQLTAIGADAAGMVGGGAGIRVPNSARLYLVGPGKVVARGGKAAGGGNGGRGAEGQFSKKGNYLMSGGGGRGGDGGGGAGAGIGGCGGDGGSGGREKPSTRHTTDPVDSYRCYAEPGFAGGAGDQGEKCGRVYIVNNPTLECTGGEASTYAGTGGAPSNGKTDAGSGWVNYYAVGGGGGGGGGGSGSAGQDIGGGGGGGGGGASGSSGGYFWQKKHQYVYRDGQGGRGGKGARDGFTGNVGGSPGDATNQSRFANGGNKGETGGIVERLSSSSPVDGELRHSAPTYNARDLVVTPSNSLARAVEAVNANANLVDADGRRRISFDVPTGANTFTEPIVFHESARSVTIDGDNHGRPVTLGNIVSDANLDLRNLTMDTLYGTNIAVRIFNVSIASNALVSTDAAKASFTNATVTLPPVAEKAQINYREKDAQGTVRTQTVEVPATATSINGSLLLPSLPYAIMADSAKTFTLTNAASLDIPRQDVVTIATATVSRISSPGALKLSDGYRARTVSGFGTLELNGGVQLHPKASTYIFNRQSPTMWSDSSRISRVSVDTDGLLSLAISLSWNIDPSVEFFISVGSQRIATSRVYVSDRMTLEYLIPVRCGDLLTVESSNGFVDLDAELYPFGGE